MFGESAFLVLRERFGGLLFARESQFCVDFVVRLGANTHPFQNRALKGPYSVS
jgi:hypothetical protein